MKIYKTILVSLVLLTINLLSIFATDLYQREERRGDYAYAVAIKPSTKFGNEYVVGLLYLGPKGQEWWRISDRSRLAEDNKFEFKDKEMYFSVQLYEDHVKVRFQGEEIDLQKVNQITYDSWPIELPEILQDN